MSAHHRRGFLRLLAALPLAIAGKAVAGPKMIAGKRIMVQGLGAKAYVPLPNGSAIAVRANADRTLFEAIQPASFIGHGRQVDADSVDSVGNPMVAVGPVRSGSSVDLIKQPSEVDQSALVQMTDERIEHRDDCYGHGFGGNGHSLSPSVSGHADDEAGGALEQPAPRPCGDAA